MPNLPALPHFITRMARIELTMFQVCVNQTRSDPDQKRKWAERARFWHEAFVKTIAHEAAVRF